MSGEASGGRPGLTGYVARGLGPRVLRTDAPLVYCNVRASGSRGRDDEASVGHCVDRYRGR